MGIALDENKESWLTGEMKKLEGTKKGPGKGLARCGKIEVQFINVSPT